MSTETGSASSASPPGLSELGQHTNDELLAPLSQTARLGGIEWLPPFVVHGTHSLDDAELQRAADDYRRVVIALRDGDVARKEV